MDINFIFSDLIFIDDFGLIAIEISLDFFGEFYFLNILKERLETVNFMLAYPDEFRDCLSFDSIHHLFNVFLLLLSFFKVGSCLSFHQGFHLLNLFNIEL